MTELNYLQETASQTAGPYVHIGLIPHQAGFDIFENNFSNVLAAADTPGERIRIEGRVLDGLGSPCRDVLIECWQADSDGSYHSDGFRGWGRTGTDFETGLWFFETVKPGPVVGRRGHKNMAPHINLWLASRGINIGLSTRLYFEDETTNAEDPVLRMIEPAMRRNTLIAKREARDGATVYVFDIRLQGQGETVFFDI
jgi:protocatechuate 3,4-dioxygenase alpha subunit